MSTEIEKTEDNTDAQIRLTADKVRKEEREKLVGKLESLENQVANLSKELQARDLTIAERDKLVKDVQSKLEAIEKVKSDGKDIDINKLVEEVAQNTRNLIEAEALKREAELRKQLEEVQNRLSKADLKIYRDEAIAKAGGAASLVMELVNGSTPEEIDNSIAVAKAAFDRVKSLSSLQQTSDGSQISTPPPVNPQGSSVSVLEQSAVKSMPLSEYRKNREKLLAESARLVPSA
jgi:DNA-binding protein YbaB